MRSKTKWSAKIWFASTLIVPGLMVGLVGCNDAIDRNDTHDIPPETVGVKSPGSPPEVTDPSEDTRGYVRAVHLVPEAGAVAIMLDGKKIIDAVAYGEVSDFVGLGGDKVDIHAEGKHMFSLVGPNGKTLAGPVGVDITKGEDVTLIVSGPKNKITITPYKSTSKPQMDKARVAILYSPQLGPQDKLGPMLSVMMDDKNMPNMTKAGEGIAYQDVAAGSHTVKVMSDKKATNTQTLNLENGKSYTLLVYKDAAGKTETKLLEEKFMPDLIKAPNVTSEKSAP